MQNEKVVRLVSLVAAAVESPDDPKSFGRSVMTAFMELLAPEVLDDARQHARLVRDSDLKWTLVRAPRLTDGPSTGNVAEGLDLKLGPFHSISRHDLALFMLEVAVTPDMYVRQSPMVAGFGRREVGKKYDG